MFDAVEEVSSVIKLKRIEYDELYLDFETVIINSSDHSNLHPLF